MDMLSDVMIDKPTQSTTPKTDSGFTLIEVMIAMAIFAFGLLALAALQIAAIKLSSDSQYVTQANLLANQAIGMMWGGPTSATLSAYNNLDTRGTLPGSPAIIATNAAVWKQDIENALPQGRGQIAVNGRQVTVTLTWRDRGGMRSYPVSTQIGE